MISADLRDHAGALDVADEDVAVGAERDDALLDAGAAGVVDADHGAADLGRQIHDLDHLLGHHLAERAAEDGEVLGEDAHAAALDRAVAGDDGVAPGPVLLHPELVRAVADERVELLEGAGVEQLLDPLAGGVLALGVLLLDRGLGRVVDGGGAQLLELGEPLLVGLGALLAHGRGILRGLEQPSRTNDSRTLSVWRSIQIDCSGGGSSRSEDLVDERLADRLGLAQHPDLLALGRRRGGRRPPRRTSGGPRAAGVSIQRCSGSRAARAAARATGPGAVRIERSVADGTARQGIRSG